MTVKLHHGDLLKATDADAIVNTVNCVGVMGKGIALQFKNRWPDNFRAYRAACKAELVRPGRMFIHDRGKLETPHYIINFPTKEHWRGKSDLELIRAGLADLVAQVLRLGIRSIAIPPLGCGHGGLEWNEVKPLILAAFEPLGAVEVRLFAPEGAPPAKSMAVSTTRPGMTAGRAALLKILAAYQELRYTLTRVEVQKLAYFLQEAGEALHLRFEKYHFGPYSDQLRHVLNRLEGHFIRGMGDGDSAAEIEPLQEALREADRFLRGSSSSDIADRVDRVARLIEGFQSSYGMELLASVHWVAHHEKARTAEEATAALHAWSDRKRTIMAPAHIATAWRRLEAEGWLAPTSDISSPAASG